MFERDRYRKEEEGSFFVLVFGVALGVYIGSLAAVYTYEAVAQWRVERAAQQALSQMRDADQRAAQARERAAQQAQQRREVQAAAMQLERERKQRKEQAWASYFTPSPDCQRDATVSCANAYAAARKRFEAEYVDR